MKKVSFIVGFIIVFSLCLAPAVFAADGFAEGVTGGEGGATVSATDAASFKSYVESTTPYIIEVSGIIDLNSVGGDVDIRSNKTIKGVSPGTTIIGQLGFRNDSSNVIIERLNITTPSGYGEGDGISVKDRISNVFITKCTLYDCADGCIDITKASDYVTVSWCKFYYIDQNGHRNVNLVGASDDDTGDIGKLHVTFHHNWYGSLCTSRMPMVRYGRAHVYNNYFNCPSDNYCVRSRKQAECLIENNYFNGVNDPYYKEGGKIKASRNVLVNCSGIIDPGIDDVFTPPYSYTLNNPMDVPIMVQHEAGADGNDTFLPHWIFGLYGDFDRSDIVDINDLEQFVDYWLDTNDIANADYYEDGIVNGYEYALFAGNWLETTPDTTAPEVPDNLWALAGDETVSLQWDDNYEIDLCGYNLFRSTTSGGGYTKLNGSPLPDSNYIDNSVSNNTMYYYVVTAVDTSGNESGDSVETCALPCTDGNNITIQENLIGFCGVDGIIDNYYAGYTGYGYANTDDEMNKGINWSVYIASTGSYTLKWRYANGSSDRPGTLYVNYLPNISGISFPGTGDWNNWSEVSVSVTFPPGMYSLRLKGIGNEGLANIDYLMVAGPYPQATTCP